MEEEEEEVHEKGSGSALEFRFRFLGEGCRVLMGAKTRQPSSKIQPRHRVHPLLLGPGCRGEGTSSRVAS